MKIESNLSISSDQIPSAQTDFPVVFYKKDPSNNNQDWLENLKQPFESDDNAIWLTPRKLSERRTNL